MEVSNEIIKIMDYLGEKIGLTIDWSSDNIVPVIKQICTHFIQWEVGTSVVWIVIAILLIIVSIILGIVTNWNEDCAFVAAILIIGSFCLIGVQTFDIVECITFPEKAIYDYIVTTIPIPNK